MYHTKGIEAVNVNVNWFFLNDYARSGQGK